MTRAGAIVEIDGLGFGYPERPLFERWSASIPAGVTLVRGGDGRGKTTLLRLIAGELAPVAGTLRVAGADPRRQAAEVRARVHWVDPRTAAFDALTPSEYFAAVRARWPDFDALRLEALIEGFALAPHLGKQLHMLSTGSRRKVWLAGALAARPPVALLDDPFGALDRGSVRCAQAALAEAAGDDARAVVITGYEAPPGVPLAADLDLGD